MTEPSYYRSLEHLADTPEFRAFAAEEFPGFANVYESLGEAEPRDDNPDAGLNRRKFLALSAAALGLAGLAGCRRPDLEILPFATVPDEQVGHIVHGHPTFYATSLPRAGGALPVLVESHDGRPTKIEGNPQHPCSRGSTDAHAQATILDLYSPDRVMSERYPGVMEGRTSRRWEDFDRFARAEGDRLAKDKGKGFYILTEQTPAPALRSLRDAIATKLLNASWHSYEPVDTSESLKGAEAAFGAKLVARYRFDKAERILALDSDFLSDTANGVYYVRAFAEKRNTDVMNRLYIVESTYTITGTMADHRLPLPASRIGPYLIALARKLNSSHANKFKSPLSLPANLTDDSSFPDSWLNAVAKDFVEHAGKSLVVVGSRQPAWVHALAHAVNNALGNYAAGMAEFRTPPAELLDKSMKELCGDIAAGKVQTLLIIGGNPAFTAPADLAFADALQKVPRKLRLGLFFDQTSEKCDWHLPLAHPLESWGDTEAGDGSLCCVQPLIAPLNSGGIRTEDNTPPARGGRSTLEVLALLTQAPGADGKPVRTFAAAQKAAYTFVRKAFAARSGIAIDDVKFDTAFNRYKQLGFLPVQDNKAAPKHVSVIAKGVTAALGSFRGNPAPARDAMEVTFHPSYSVYDGRFAMNRWLQEMPDPITKLVWDNAAIISPATSRELGVVQGDVLEIRVGERSVAVPAFVLPGQADYSVALVFGQYGEMRIAHVPNGGGTNVYPLRTSNAQHTVTGATLTNTGRKYDLVTTQEHGVIPEGRDIIRERSLSGEKRRAEHAVDGHITEEMLKKEFQGGYGNPQQGKAPVKAKQERFPLDLARPELLDSQFQWGMVIDLNSCTGCTACQVACQAENNIPVVGKTEVKRNREMHWIRIDRYFSSLNNTTAADAPRIVSQPVACVHCEAAPCEQVCPVNAAVHSPEGLNLQVYNRCIGTRYCSNACPYKVRRFNWFDFNKRRLDELRVPTPFASGGTSLTESGVPETLKMQKNPDVTVRMRGVMEKCTYCVQRIERGKIGAKIAATEVAQDRRTIETNANFKTADGSLSSYKKPIDPLAAGYDLDALGRVIVPDGIIVTACQSACPSQAITFGNVLDPNSKVSKQKLKESEYLLLGELNTKPRTSYLPRIRNVNPDM